MMLPVPARRLVSAMAPWSSIAVPLGVACAATAMLFITNGYIVWESDQFIYLPQILHAADPTFLARDLVVSYAQSRFSIFGPLLLAAMHFLHVSFESLALIIWCGSYVVVYLGIYLIARHLVNGVRTAAAITLSVCASATVAIPIFISYAHPRGIALALVVISFALLLRERYVISAFAAAFAALLHPITAILGIALFCAFAVVNFLRGTAFTPGIVAWILPFAALVVMYVGGGGLGGAHAFFMDSAWLHTVAVRNYSVLVSAWPAHDFVVRAGVALFGGALYVLAEKQRTRRIVAIALLAVAMCLLGNIFFGDILHISAVIQAQTLRVFEIGKLIIAIAALAVMCEHASNRLGRGEMFMLLGATLTTLVLDVATIPFSAGLLLLASRRAAVPDMALRYVWLTSRSLLFVAWGVCTAGLMALVVFYAAKGTEWKSALIALICFAATAGVFLNRRFPSLWPFIVPVLFAVSSLTAGLVMGVAMRASSGLASFEANPAFMSACGWIQQTPHDALFVVEPFSSAAEAVRMLCGRSVYFTWKDGAQSVFDRSYALEWRRRSDLLNRAKTSDDMGLLASEGVDYVFSDVPVADWEKKTAFRAGSRYVIYEVR